LVSHTWTPALYHSWDSIGDSRLFARIVKYNFFFENFDVVGGDGVGKTCPDSDPGVPFNLCGPDRIREDIVRDRDGWGVSPGFDHTLPILDDLLIARAGYRFHYYNADGKDFSYWGNEIQLGAEILLGHHFRFEAFGSYTSLNYLHPSSFPDPDGITLTQQYGLSTDDRNDDLLRVDAVIDRPISNNATVSARYSYYNSSSTAKAFQYRHHVVGLYATIRFTPSSARRSK
jgi:hypothetical protein